MATWADEGKTQIRELTRHLQSTEEEITWARSERNHHLEVERSFATTLEQTVENKVVEALALAQIQAKEERERLIDATVSKYLASEAFQVMKVGCYLDDFKCFKKVAAETFPDLDFSISNPEEEEEEEEEGK